MIKFSDIYDLYRNQQASGDSPPDQSLADFAKEGNAATNSQDFDAANTGTFGGLIKKGSYWLDRGLNATHLPEYAGQLGRWAATQVGASPEVGQSVGEGFPRALAEMAPMALGPAGVPLSAALMAGHTYAEGGSPVQVAGSLAAPFVMGKGGEIAAGFAQKLGLVPITKVLSPSIARAGAATRDIFEQTYLKGLGGSTANYLAHSVGAVAAGELNNYVTSSIANNDWNPLAHRTLKDWLFETTAGTLPFVAMGAAGIRSGNTPLGKPDFVRSEPIPQRPSTPATAAQASTVQANANLAAAIAAANQLPPAQQQAAIAAATTAHQAATNPPTPSTTPNPWTTTAKTTTPAPTTPLTGAPASTAPVPPTPPTTTGPTTPTPASTLAQLVQTRNQSQTGTPPQTPAPTSPSQPTTTPQIQIAAGSLFNRIRLETGSPSGEIDFSSLDAPKIQSIIDEAKTIDPNHPGITGLIAHLEKELVKRNAPSSSPLPLAESSAAQSVRDALINPPIPESTGGVLDSGASTPSVDDGSDLDFNMTGHKPSSPAATSVSNLDTDNTHAVPGPEVTPEIRSVVEATEPVTKDDVVTPENAGNALEHSQLVSTMADVPVIDAKALAEVHEAHGATAKEAAKEATVEVANNVTEKAKEKVKRSKTPEQRAAKKTQAELEKQKTLQGFLDTYASVTQAVKNKTPELPFDEEAFDKLNGFMKKMTKGAPQDVVAEWAKWRQKMAGKAEPTPKDWDDLQKGMMQASGSSERKAVKAGNLESNIGEEAPWNLGKKTQATEQAAFELKDHLNAQGDEKGLLDGHYVYEVYKDGGKFRVSRKYANSQLKGEYEGNRQTRQKEAYQKAEDAVEALTTTTKDPDVKMAQTVLQDDMADFLRSNQLKLQESGLIPADQWAQKSGDLIKAFNSGKFDKQKLVDRMAGMLEDWKAKQGEQIVDTGEDLTGEKYQHSFTKEYEGQTNDANLAATAGDVKPNFIDYGTAPRTEVWAKLLSRLGVKGPLLDHYVKGLDRIFDLFGMSRAKLGEIRGQQQGFAYGAATRNPITPQIFLQLDAKLGEAGVLRTAQATSAHELAHLVDEAGKQGLLDPEAKAKLDGWRDWVTENPMEAKTMLNEWRQQLDPEFRDLDLWKHLLGDSERNMTPDELMANSMAMAALTKMDSEGMKVLDMITPPEQRGWFRTIARNVRRLISAVRGWNWLAKNKSQYGDVIENLKKQFDSIAQSMRESDKMMGDLYKTVTAGTQDGWENQAFGPDGQQINVQDPAMAVKLTDEQEHWSPFNKLMKGFVTTMKGLTDQFPALKRAAAVLYQMEPSINAMHNMHLGPMFGGINQSTGQLSMRGEMAKVMDRMSIKNNAKASKLNSDLAQLLQRDSTQTFSEQWLTNHPSPVWPPGSKNDLVRQWNSMSPQVKSDIKMLFKGTEQSIQKIGETVSQGHRQLGKNLMTNFVGSQLETDQWHTAPLIAEDFANAFDKTQLPNPQDQMAGQQALVDIEQQLKNPTAMQKLMDMWSATQAGAGGLENFFASNPGFMSTLRFGTWRVKAFKRNARPGNPDDVFEDNINNIKDADKWRAKRYEEGYTEFQTPERDTGFKNQFVAEDAFMQALDQAENSYKAAIQASGLPMATQQELMALSLRNVMAQHFGAKDAGVPGLVGGTMSRKLTPGSMNMLETHKLFSAITARAAETKNAKSRLTYEMSNPELMKFPDRLEHFKEMSTNFMTPDSQLGLALTKMNGVYYLGGSIAAPLTIATHSVSSMHPELVRRGDGQVQGLMRMAKAVGIVNKFTADLVGEKIGVANEGSAISKIKDGELQEFLRWMNKRGWMSFVENSGMDASADTAIDLNDLTNDGAMKSLADRAKSVGSNFADFSMKAYSAADHLNKRIAAVAGFMQAREAMGAGYNREAAFKQAEDFIQTATYSVGKANRPTTLYEGKHRLLGHMAYSLSKYNLGWLNQLMRYTAEWKGSSYMPLDPVARRQAGKAALTMLGTKMMMAGALGLPFVGSALKIAEKLTGKELTSGLWTNLSQLLGEDKEQGGELTNAIMMGGANSMLARSGVPVDMGSRWAFSGILGLNSYDGFSGDAVFGPTAGVISSVTAGLKQASQGEFMKAAAAMSPPSTRRAIKYWMNDQSVRTLKGTPVDTSPAENWAYVLGFDPQKLTYQQKIDHMKQQVDVGNVMQDKQAAGNILDTLNRNPGGIKQALNEEAMRSSREPKDVAHAVAKTAADQNFPEDIRTGLPTQQALHLMEVAKIMGVPMPQATSVVRDQYMSNLMNMMGFKGTNAPRSAYLQDDMLDQGGYVPKMTAAEMHGRF